MEPQQVVKHLQFIIHLQRKVTHRIEADDIQGAERIEQLIDDYCTLHGIEDFVFWGAQ